MKTIVLVVLLFVACTTAYEVITPPAGDAIDTSLVVKAVSKDYFYLASFEPPIRIIKYMTNNVTRIKHSHVADNKNIQVEKLALSTDGRTLYAIVSNITADKTYTLSAIDTETMTFLDVNTFIPKQPATVSNMYATTKYLCIIVDSTLSRYTLEGQFMDKTELDSIPFEYVDTAQGTLYFKGSTGIDRVSVHTLERLPVIPLNWTWVGDVQRSSLTNVNGTLYIVNKVEVPIYETGRTTCPNCWRLYTITDKEVTRAELGQYSGRQPNIVQHALAPNEIAIAGSVSFSGAASRPGVRDHGVCVINTIQQSMNCTGLFTDLRYVYDDVVYVSSSKVYMLGYLQITEYNLFTRNAVYIPYGPVEHQVRNGKGMIFVGDELFYCAAGAVPSLVGMNLITNKTREIRNLACVQLVYDNNVLYAATLSEQSSIVSIDLATLNVTVIETVTCKYGCTEWYRAWVYSILGYGVLYTSNHITYKKILGSNGAVTESFELPPGITQTGSKDFVYDDSNQYYVFYGNVNLWERKIIQYRIEGKERYPVLYPEQRNPMQLCHNLPLQGIFIDKKYGYIVCNKVIKFELNTGVVQGIYLNGADWFVANRLAIRGGDVYVGGAKSNMLLKLADSDLTPVKWPEIIPTQQSTEKIPTQQSSASKVVFALATIFVLLVSL
jgi:hypothetical protein